MNQPAPVISATQLRPVPCPKEVSAPARYQIIIIDDDRADRALVRRCLRERSDFRCDVHEAATAEAGLKLLETYHFDCALVDYRLPPSCGLRLLERYFERWPHSTTAFIMLTAQGSEEIAASAMRSGASDYLPKHRATPDALVRAIANASEKMSLRASLSAKTRALQERNRVLSARNEEVRRFYQNVCHELRTPLAATREFVALINDGIVGPVSDEQRDLLRLATDGCDQITALLDDLLDAARMQTGKLSIRPEPVALATLSQDALRAHEGEAKSRQVDLSLELDDSGGALQAHADPVRIKQVIANLVGNALKFTPAEGKVRVALRHEPFQPQWIEVVVQDTGCGISEGSQRYIFDRLYQSPNTANGVDSASGGLGLGLAISSEIVRLHGSELEVRSQEGEGSTFSFLLPTSQRQAHTSREDDRE